MLWLFGRQADQNETGKRWKYLSDDLREARKFIAIEHRPEFLRNPEYRRDFESHKADQRILVRIEPPVVNPWQYMYRVETDFGLVLTEDCLASKYSWLAGYFDKESDSRLRHSLESFVWTTRPLDAVAVMANKFSFQDGELYSLRRRAWRAIDQSNVSFCLFGREWGDSLGRTLGKLTVELGQTIRSGRTPTFAGQLPLRVPQLGSSRTIDTPHSGYQQARVAVVIENFPNRVTEKLYQAIESGCRVLYVGGKASFLKELEPLVHFADPLPDSIMGTLHQMLETDTLQIRRNAQEQAFSLIGSRDLQMEESMRKLESLISEGAKA